MRMIRPLGLTLGTLLLGSRLIAQSPITTPDEHLGFFVGEDYHLANYSQLVAYWQRLERQSNRLSLEEIGTTAEGRSMWMAIISSPRNQARLDRYKEIAKRMALARGVSEREARQLSREGRSIVWIDGGIHATEVLGSQQLIELVYQLVLLNDPETARILDDVIILVTCSNPDGMELVANWYMRESEPTNRSTRDLPRLYQKYVGHDNNRDFYMVTQPETEAINRVLYREWYPQVIYNHHQSGPAGSVLFAPPFRDPFNHNLDPLMLSSLELIGAAMHSRFIREGKPGTTMRSGGRYSSWWNGGLRTTAYFHNMIGILTETIGHPTPTRIPFLPEKQLPSGDYPYPVPPMEWYFVQSIDYSMTANRAVLDTASKFREEFLWNIYRMGRNSIERGSRDHWTIHDNRIADIKATLATEGVEPVGRGRTRGFPREYFELMRKPENRDPRGYILPSNQPDFLTATKFVNALIKNGVSVSQATTNFYIRRRQFEAGSYVVKTNQAFRPHILDMFEPQYHPNDIPYEGAPPVAPYDGAGWTLAYQMGVEFERILDGFDGPFKNIPDALPPPAGSVSGPATVAGFLLDHRINDSFRATNRLLRQGESVYWVERPFSEGSRDWKSGTLFVPSRTGTRVRLERLAKEIGVDAVGVDTLPAGPALKINPVRLGLWDRYGGSIASGWVRWLLEQFEMPFDLVYSPSIDEGRLRDKYDMLVFVGDSIPSLDEPTTEPNQQGLLQFNQTSIPAEYRSRIGRVSVERSIPQLRSFLEQGGTILAIGDPTILGYHLDLPIRDGLSELQEDGTLKKLTQSRFYVPGSILNARVQNRHPLGYGLGESVNLYFNNSPVFQFVPESMLHNVKPLVWFDEGSPLRSGWAWGQAYLKDAVAALEGSIGDGKLILFGPEITFRAQSHATFKFLFNAIHYAGATQEDSLE